MTEHTVLVAFTVEAPTFREAQVQLALVLPAVFGGKPLTSWWVAEDERYDGSDCDSAVFVSPGNQPAASRILHAAGLTPVCNLKSA